LVSLPLQLLALPRLALFVDRGFLGDGLGPRGMTAEHLPRTAREQGPGLVRRAIRVMLTENVELDIPQCGLVLRRPRPLRPDRLRIDASAEEHRRDLMYLELLEDAPDPHRLQFIRQLAGLEHIERIRPLLQGPELLHDGEVLAPRLGLEVELSQQPRILPARLALADP